MTFAMYLCNESSNLLDIVKLISNSVIILTATDKTVVLLNIINILSNDLYFFDKI